MGKAQKQRDVWKVLTEIGAKIDGFETHAEGEWDKAAIYNINVYGVRQATVSISHTKSQHKRKYVL